MTQPTKLYEEASRPYYFSEFDGNIEATRRMAEYKRITMKHLLADRYVDSQIVEEDGYLKVVVTYK